MARRRPASRIAGHQDERHVLAPSPFPQEPLALEHDHTVPHPRAAELSTVANDGAPT